MERQIRFFTGGGAPWELEYTNSSASQLLGTMDLPVVEGTAAPFDVIISVAIDEDELMNFTAVEGDRSVYNVSLYVTVSQSNF